MPRNVGQQQGQQVPEGWVHYLVSWVRVRSLVVLSLVVSVYLPI